MRLTPTSKILRELREVINAEYRSDPDRNEACAVAVESALILLLESLTAQQDLQDRARSGD